MNKGTNLSIVEYESKLLNVINSSGMPPEITRLVLSELLDNTKRTCVSAVKFERDRYMKKVAKERGVQDGKA